MYTLYFSEREKSIKVSKARKTLLDLDYKEEITRFNDCFYICAKRKPLLEKGREIQKEWILKLEQELETLKKLKI